ncbi:MULTISPECIES: hypothetical protein [Sphingobium]|jgi:hypothetical protein|nr:MULTISPECIES: hypothetical protein [Sphingobium]
MMRALSDLVQLGRLVAATHGWPAARTFKAYDWSEQDRAGIASGAADILKLFPATAGQEQSLSATLAFQLQRRLDAPVHLVAGTLRVEGMAVRQDRLPSDGTSPFAADAPAWRGHLWIMVGPHVVDAAIFRLANAADSNPVLARHVHGMFGSDKGLYADHWRQARRVGLDYDPLYVLSEEDMSHLLNAAYRLIKDGAA